MFRRQLLLCACLSITFVAATAPVWAQDLTTEERIDRLERDLNMLQRQVYGGGPPPPVAAVPPPGAAGPGGGAVNLEVRMEQLEQQMRDVTGRVEELGNRMDQLHQRIDQIAGRASEPVGPAANPPPPIGPATAPAAGPFPPAGPADARAPPPGPASLPGSPAAEAGAPTPIFGTLQPPGAAQPMSPPPVRAATATAPPPKATHAAPPSGTPQEQFDYAFKLVRKADYPGAETALRAFIAHHPADRLAGSAEYWLGETYFARGRYLEAASAFAEGYKRWPKGPKAADGLFKLGIALARANQKQNACLAFSQLNHDFPHPGTAIRQRASAERRRLGC